MPEILPKMTLCKGHDLKRLRSQGKINGTIGFLDFKIIDLDTKIVILKCFNSKVMVMKSFCIMVANVTCLHRSHVQTAKNTCLIY